jgi:subtilisin family serine protease
LGVLQLKFETLAGEETSDGCLIVALLHLASSSEVAGLEITKKMRLQGHAEKIEAARNPRLRSAKGRELDGSASGVGVLNYVAVTALQSGDSSKPYPFWSVGINGSDQYVQVTDTGFDDASCFLRDTDASKSVLKGPFNFDVQLARSTYDSPITDTSRRKIVQYIEVSSSDDTYKYDYVDGHGTHVAGTVAGRLASDGNNVEVKNYYSDCSDYSGSCSSLFCATCTYSNYCDGMCGFLDNEDFSGMAPSAKIMVSDCIFGVDFILFLSHTNNVLQGV